MLYFKVFIMGAFLRNDEWKIVTKILYLLVTCGLTPLIYLFEHKHL